MSVKNASSICFEDIEKSIANWKIPKYREIYHVGTFSLRSDYFIKTIEKTCRINTMHETLTQAVEPQTLEQTEVQSISETLLMGMLKSLSPPKEKPLSNLGPRLALTIDPR